MRNFTNLNNNQLKEMMSSEKMHKAAENEITCWQCMKHFAIMCCITGPFYNFKHQHVDDNEQSEVGNADEEVAVITTQPTTEPNTNTSSAKPSTATTPKQVTVTENSGSSTEESND